jgi:hypothetical protein
MLSQSLRDLTSYIAGDFTFRYEIQTGSWFHPLNNDEFCPGLKRLDQWSQPGVRVPSGISEDILEGTRKHNNKLGKSRS